MQSTLGSTQVPVVDVPPAAPRSASGSARPAGPPPGFPASPHAYRPSQPEGSACRSPAPRPAPGPSTPAVSPDRETVAPTRDVGLIASPRPEASSGSGTVSAPGSPSGFAAA